MTNQEQVTLQRRLKSSLGHTGRLENLKRDVIDLKADEDSPRGRAFYNSLLENIEKEVC